MLHLFDMKNCLRGDDDDDHYVSDLSDDDSYSDCDRYPESVRRSTISNATMKYVYTSMAPEGVHATTRDTVKQVLVLTNVPSMQSLTAGSENDDAPRIPSRANISSSSTSALRKHHKTNDTTKRNASWHDRQKPAGETSNFVMSQIKLSTYDGKSSTALNQKLCTEMSAERPILFQDLQTVSRRRPPSRTDLRSTYMPTLQYGVINGTDYRNATWNDIPANQPAEQPLCSPFESKVRTGNAINLTFNVTNRLPHDPSVTSLNKSSSHSTDSPPRLPNRTQLEPSKKSENR